MKNNRIGFKLKSDWVFKAVYGADTEDSRAALKAFLNVVLDRKDDPINEVKVLNPIILRDSKDLKEVVLDIHAMTDAGDNLDVEMQTYGFNDYPPRALYNGAKLISTSLASSTDYDKIKTTIVISVIDGIVFKDITKKHSLFKVCEVDTGHVMTDKAEWHFLELGKLDVDADPDLMTDEEILMAYLKYFGDAEKYDYFDKLLKRRMEVIEMSEKMIEGLSEDFVAQILKISQEKQERDRLHRDNMVAKQARQQQRDEDIKEFIDALRELGQSDDDIVKRIMKNHDISEEEIRKLMQ